jgi:hypothetical protein
MTKTDINGLLAFLKDNAKSDEARALVAELVEHMLRRLETVVASDEWLLIAEADEKGLERLAADVGELVGRPNLRCMTVSVSHPFHRPDRMSVTEVLDNLGLHGTLEDCLWTSLGRSFLADLEHDLYVSLLVSLHKTDLLRHLSNDHFISLILCLSFAIVGDRERTERLARILEAYAVGVMPLGFKSVEPDVLIVLVD